MGETIPPLSLFHLYPNGKVSEAFKIAAPGGIVGNALQKRKWETP